MDFKQLGLKNELLRSLKKLQYETCTSVQEEAIPCLLNKQDCIIQARTGSGKTAAFGLGILEQLDWNTRLPQALILAPTRELAMQIQEELKALGIYQKLRSVLLLGRQPYKRQMEQLKDHCHLVIGTPGRVKDHIDRGSLKLEQVQTVVLDEADQMLNMGFIDLVRSILKLLPSNHQTVLCSATMPDAVKKIADDFLQEPVWIKAEESASPQIHQFVAFCEEADKAELLTRLLACEQVETAMIFGSTHEEVDEIYDVLSRLHYSCGKLHGGMMQNDRLAVMEDFRRGKFRYLVATDVAARGIDVASLAMVVHLHLPRSRATFVHRMGRSGRMHEIGQSVLLTAYREKSYAKELFADMDLTYEEIDVKTLMSTSLDETQLHFVSASPKSRTTKTEIIRMNVIRLHLNGGKNKKIRKGDIVGAICELESISGEDIGVIEIKDNGSTVDILNGKGKAVLKHLQSVTIKGKKLRIEKARD